MSDVLIEVKGVSFAYARHDVLKDVDLKIKKGDFIGIIGPNGGGKTTLLKIMLGLLKPTKGSVKIKKGIFVGYVPQYPSFDPDFPIQVKDVVLSSYIDGKRPWTRIGKKEKRNAEKALDMLGIKNIMNKQIGSISGGEKQRVLIARALARNPDVLILDEPTASVDTESGKKIYGTLEKLNKDGVAIVIVSHDMGVVSRYVKTVACMNVWLFGHGSKKMTGKMLEKAYACPVDVIAHGHPHRVYTPHEGEDYA